MEVILPKNYSDYFKQVLTQPYNAYRQKLPIVKYPDCYFTNTGIGLKSFKLIEETLFSNITKEHRWHFYKYALYKYITGKKLKLTGKNILLIHNHWSSGYHHWVTEALAKLTLINTEDYILVIPEDYSKFAFDGLGLFNFKEVIRLPKEHGLVASNVTLIANPNSGSYDPSLLSPLKRLLIQKCSGKVEKKEAFEYIYISRKNEAFRKVENENEVIELLGSYGFKVVDIMSLSFYEQVMLFSNCKVLVSIHGAALTNAMFMPSGSKVLELYRNLTEEASWMNTCYYNLVTVSGLDYYYQFCKHGTYSGPNLDKVNIVVDIEKLKKNIQLIMGTTK
jgi:capsular polysaccharide biosynthesis protein